MKKEADTKNLQTPCIDLAFEEENLDRGVIEWTIPYRPVLEQNRPVLEQKPLKVIHITPIRRVKKSDLIMYSFEFAQVAFVFFLIVAIGYGIVQIVLFLSDPAVIRTILSIVCFGLILFALLVAFTSRKPGRAYTDTTPIDYSWNVRPDRTTGQSNRTSVTVIGDNATVNTNISNNQNRTCGQ